MEDISLVQEGQFHSLLHAQESFPSLKHSDFWEYLVRLLNVSVLLKAGQSWTFFMKWSEYICVSSESSHLSAQVIWGTSNFSGGKLMWDHRISVTCFTNYTLRFIFWTTKYLSFPKDEIILIITMEYVIVIITKVDQWIITLTVMSWPAVPISKQLCYAGIERRCYTKG